MQRRYTIVEATDRELVRRATVGDTAAFDALVDRHYEASLRFAVRMLGSRADAEEAVQDAFLDAYRGLGAYREQHRFHAWLMRILVNRCRSLARSNRRRWRRLLRYATREPARDIPPAPLPTTGPGRVENALQSLPVAWREAFLLRHLHDLRYEEMAAITGAGESALKMRVKRARDRLREILEPLVEDDGNAHQG